jgi:hypothetical protein
VADARGRRGGAGRGELADLDAGVPHPVAARERGLSSPRRVCSAAAPNVGVLLTLVLWGAATDRWGERGVLVTGCRSRPRPRRRATSRRATSRSDRVRRRRHGSACASSASGRVVIGWFPAERRGFAMGIRQMAQPLGRRPRRLVVPPLVSRRPVQPAARLGGGSSPDGGGRAPCSSSIRRPRAGDRCEGRPANPYRGDATLVRIHLVSALLVVPQYVLTTFGLVWLIADQGWEATAAGVPGRRHAQFLGALGGSAPAS